MEFVPGGEHSGEAWRVGQRVRVRGAVWEVLEHTRFAGCGALRLAEAGRIDAGAARTILVPFDRPQPVDTSRSLQAVRPRRFLHALRRRALHAQPFGSLATAARAGVRVFPYQLEPALAMLRHGATRVLIADAVGLGKTVQSGLVLSELAAARDTFRAVIVTPAGLRDQWCCELATHFGLRAVVTDAAWLMRGARELPADVNPWTLPGIYIVSFDLLKRPEVLRPLEDTTWDLLVVDEAHGATLGTQRRAAVHAIGVRSRRVLLLTATPHSGEPDEFNALCRIGSIDPPGEPILIFRRTRADVQLPDTRRSRLMAVRLSAAEIHMHRLLDRYSGAVCREAAARGDQWARLAVVLLRKRALSSAASLARSIARRITLLAASVSPVERQLLLPLSDGEVEDEAPDAVLGVPGLADSTTERRWLDDIAAAASMAAVRESKVGFLLRWLGRLGEPAIVFTEYRDTLTELQGAIERAGLTVLALHGGLAAADRIATQRAFNEHGGLLLATDAAAEGLNLHGRCRAIVHFELPWSPVRLEQRAGRVDRIGQTRVVHEIALVANDTAERLVLAPLARRAARVRSALGGPSNTRRLISESRVVCAVLDGVPLDGSPSTSARETAVPPQAYSRQDLGSEAANEAARVLQHRAWMASMPRASVRIGREPANVCLVAALGRGTTALEVTAIYTRRLVAPDGWTAHADVTAVTIRTDTWRVDGSARAVRAAVGDWIARIDPAARSVIESESPLQLRTIAELHHRALDALERRERGMSTMLSSAARQIVQGNLFDQRAARRAEARQRTTSALVEESDRRSGAELDNRELRQEIELSAVLLRLAR